MGMRFRSFVGMRMSLLTAGRDADGGVHSKSCAGDFALVLATGAALLAMAPSAQADHHFVSIAEVFPGISEAARVPSSSSSRCTARAEQLRPRRESESSTTLSGSVTSGLLDLPDVARRLQPADGPYRHVRDGDACSPEAGRYGVRERRLDPAGGGVCLLSTYSPVRLTAWRGARPRSPVRRHVRGGDPRRLARYRARSSALAATRCSRPATTPIRASTTSPRGLPTPQPKRGDAAESTQAAPTPTITKKPKAEDHGPHAEVRVLGRRRIPLQPRRVEGRGVRLWRLQARQAVEGQAQVRRQRDRDATAPSTAPRPSTPGRSSRGGSRLAACPGLEDPAQVVRAVGRVHLERSAQRRSARRGRSTTSRCSRREARGRTRALRRIER